MANHSVNRIVLLLFSVVYLVAGEGCNRGDNEVSQDTANMESGALNEDQNSELEPMFNGTDLTGWDGDSRFWRVENGVIIGETSEETPTEENTFLIWEGGAPSNFEVGFQYRFVETGSELSGNSGFQYRSERFANDHEPNLLHRVRGPQADFAVSDWIPGIHYEEGGRGILAQRGQRVTIGADGEPETEQFAEGEDLAASITHTEWNDYVVYANGDTMRSYINNELMHELIDHSSEAAESGIMAFQIHTGPPMRVELKNIELRILD